MEINCHICDKQQWNWSLAEKITKTYPKDTTNGTSPEAKKKGLTTIQALLAIQAENTSADFYTLNYPVTQKKISGDRSERETGFPTDIGMEQW